MPTDAIARHHALRRTSPKGQNFVGVCMNCGTTGLTTANMGEECPNQGQTTVSETLMKAVDPKDH